MPPERHHSTPEASHSIPPLHTIHYTFWRRQGAVAGREWIASRGVCLEAARTPDQLYEAPRGPGEEGERPPPPQISEQID